MPALCSRAYAMIGSCRCEHGIRKKGRTAIFCNSGGGWDYSMRRGCRGTIKNKV